MASPLIQTLNAHKHLTPDQIVAQLSNNGWVRVRTMTDDQRLNLIEHRRVCFVRYQHNGETSMVEDVDLNSFGEFTISVELVQSHHARADWFIKPQSEYEQNGQLPPQPAPEAAPDPE